MCPGGGSDRPASHENIPNVMQKPPLKEGGDLLHYF